MPPLFYSPQLASPWPALANASTCGPQLQCLMAVRNGAVKAASLLPLDEAGLLYQLQVSTSSLGNLVSVMVMADPCNPASTPVYLQVVYDKGIPVVRESSLRLRGV